ncbi:MAG: DUF2442 domain-containing protein [Aeromonas sp.]
MPKYWRSGRIYMELTDEMIQQANERAANNPAARAISASYSKHKRRLLITLSSGLELAFAPQLVQGLGQARLADLQEIEISPSGLGIHFPKLDADIYLPKLLAGFFGSAHWATAQAAYLGAQGGKSCSSAKANAARRNGAKGGRPSKPKGSKLI